MDYIEHYIPEALREIIYEALENEKYEIIQGIECFSGASPSDDIRGVAIIIQELFKETLWAWEEAKRIKERLEGEEYYRYMELGIAEKMSENEKRYREGWIQKDPLIEPCILSEISRGKGRKRAENIVLKRIKALENHGFIETEGEYIRLSKIWFPYIEKIRDNDGEQQKMYIYAIGEVIGYALVGEIRYGLDREKIPKTVSVLMNVLNKVDKDGKIKEDDIIEEYLTKKVKPNRWSEFKGKDKMKTKDIRAIVSEKDGYIYFNRDMIRANELIHKRAWQLYMQRQRGV